MACDGDRAFLEAPLLSSLPLAPDIVAIECAWAGQPPSPGQFFLVRARRSSVLLGRAISVFGWEPGRHDDADRSRGAGGTGGVLRFLVARRGRGSGELVELVPGDAVELTGPLGTGWPAPAEGRTALVSGGVGIAPLAFLAGSLPPDSYDLYAGFRSGSLGLDNLRPARVTIATEDGSEGRTGRITEFFEPAPYRTVYACGPEAMLRAVARACVAAGVACYLSLERRMACGVGACLGCAVPTVAGNRRCCVDGPVFDAREVLIEA